MNAVTLFDTEEQSNAAWEIQQPRLMAAAEALGVSPEMQTGDVVHHV